MHHRRRPWPARPPSAAGGVNQLPADEPAAPVALPGPGDLVLAAGVGVTGLPVVRYLAGTGASVVVSSNRPAPPELAAIAGDVTFAGDLTPRRSAPRWW